MSRSSCLVRLCLLALGALAALGSGTTTGFTQFNRPVRAMQPRSAQSVEVYASQPPSRPYVEVGMIEARQSSIWSMDDMHEIIGHMRSRAAQLGCDAIIITGAADRVVSTPGSVSHQNGRNTYVGGGSRTLAGYRSVCIQFKGRPTEYGAPQTRVSPDR